MPRVNFQVNTSAAGQTNRTANRPNSTQQKAQRLALALFKRVNRYRVSQGKSPLQLVSYASKQAKGHSNKMARGQRVFSHAGFGGRTNQIARVVRVKSIAENVATNKGARDPVETAFKGLKRSPGHNANMLGNFNKTGMGVGIKADGTIYFTQIFLKV